MGKGLSKPGSVLDQLFLAASLAVACALVVATAPDQAGAEAITCSTEDRAQAEHHKRAGWELVKRDCSQAVAKLERANELCPDPWYLGHLAVCYEKLGRVTAAMEAIDDYLVSPASSQRGDALAARDRLASLLCRLSVETDLPGARVIIDDEQMVPNFLTPGEATLDPGEHEVEIRLEGFAPQTRTVTLEPGQTQSLRVELAEPAPEPEQPPVQDEPAPGVGDGGTGVSFTAAAQVGGGVSLPIAMDDYGVTAVVALDLSVGVDIELVRIELAASLLMQPHGSGYLLQAGGGPRLGLRVGALPLRLEIEAVIGAAYMQINESGLAIDEGAYVSLTIVPAFAIAWQVLGWLELVARPARFELLGIVGELHGGFSVRYSLDLGLRARF